MSGTSLDGIDVAIVDITGSGFKAKINVVASHSVPYPRKIREALLAMSNPSAITGDISRLNFLLGELYAEALEETAERAEVPLESIKLIGCHGQTIFHEGQGSQYLGKKVSSTFQIGESSVISERTGLPLEDALEPSVLRQAIEEDYVAWRDDRLVALPAGRLRLDALLAALVR